MTHFWKSLVLVAATAALVGCGMSPERLVAAYLATTTVTDRAAFVAEREAVTPFMERFYGKKFFADIDLAKVPPTDVSVERTSKEGDVPVLVHARWRTEKGQLSGDYIVVQEGDKNKIDWAGSVGFNDVTIRDAPAGRLRLRVVLSTHPDAKKVLNRRGSGAATRTSVYRVAMPGSEILKYDLFVGRDSELDHELSKLHVSDGSKITVDLRAADGGLVAERLVSRSWHIPRDAPRVSDDPSPLSFARPLADVDEWVRQRDATDVVRVEAVRIKIADEPDGEARALLVPCEEQLRLFGGNDGRTRYSFIVKAPSAASAAPTQPSCSSLVLAFAHAHYLPPDEPTVAHVEAVVLDAAPSPARLPTSLSANGLGTPLTRAKFFASAALYGDALRAIVGVEDPESSTLRSELGIRELALTQNVALANVRKRDVVADPARFRGKSFVTSMCCGSVQLSEYVVAGPFAELNYSAGQQHNMACYIEWELKQKFGLLPLGPDVEIDSWTEVRMSSGVAKLLAADGASTPFDDVICKQQVSGTFWFGGQVSGTRPVFHLKALHPARPPLPGFGSDWKAATEGAED